MVEAVVTQLPRPQLGAQFFCNLDVIADQIKPKKACMFQALRRTVIDRIQSETGLSPDVTRNIIVCSDRRKNREKFYTGSRDAQRHKFHWAQATKPDQFIFDQVKKLRDTHAVLLVESIPPPDWWQAIGHRKVAVTIVRNRENIPAIQDQLKVLGVFSAFALTDSQHWTVEPDRSSIPISSIFEIAECFRPECFEDDSAPPIPLEEPVELITYTPVILPTTNDTELPPRIVETREIRAQQRMVIIIDGANLNAAHDLYVTGERHGKKIDFEKLRAILTNDRQLVGCYYVARVPDYPNERGVRSFYRYLRHAGYEVVAPTTLPEKGDDWDDRQIRENLIDWSEGADVVLLASGDGGYAEILTELRKEGKIIQILATPENLSRELVQGNTKVIDLKKTIRKCQGLDVEDDCEDETPTQIVVAPEPVTAKDVSIQKKTVTLTLTFSCPNTEVGQAITQLTGQIETIVGEFSPDYRFQRVDA